MPVKIQSWQDYKAKGMRGTNYPFISKSAIFYDNARVRIVTKSEKPDAFLICRYTFTNDTFEVASHSRLQTLFLYESSSLAGGLRGGRFPLTLPSPIEGE